MMQLQKSMVDQLPPSHMIMGSTARRILVRFFGANMDCHLETSHGRSFHLKRVDFYFLDKMQTVIFGQIWHIIT